VSSTGHLILASGLMGLSDTPEGHKAVSAFNIVIQGGAILAVLGLYRQRVWQMIRGLLGKDRAGLRLATNIIVAFLPAAALGFAFNDFMERHLFSATIVLTMLAVGGVYMIALDKAVIAPRRKEQTGITLDELSPPRALVIGLLQCIAMVPGTSRSMMTITGGVLVGLKPKDAAEFSFLLGLPTLGGACALTLFKDFTRPDGEASMFGVIGWQAVAVGMLVSMVSAMLAVKWLVGFLNKHGLAPFGWYRLALTVVLLGALLAGWIAFVPEAA
jgi:undecaprenyl-diphosphatase